MKAADLLRRCRAAARDHRARAARDRQALDYGPEDLAVLAGERPHCVYCGRPLLPGEVAFDHKTPTCRAADYRLTNVAVSCRPCNEAKGQLSAGEFAQLLALLRTWPPRAFADVLGRLRAGWTRYRGGR
jgi:5-methylcytosine-specific restriction endonuclease McrA